MDRPGATVLSDRYWEVTNKAPSKAAYDLVIEKMVSSETGITVLLCFCLFIIFLAVVALLLLL